MQLVGKISDTNTRITSLETAIYNYNSKPYREYYRRRTKAGHTQTNKECVRYERMRGGCVWSTERMKFLHYRRVGRTVNTHNN